MGELINRGGKGRRKREEGRGKREEGRGKREEGRGKREEGRGKREGTGERIEGCEIDRLHFFPLHSFFCTLSSGLFPLTSFLCTPHRSRNPSPAPHPE
jgi:hypothetical protein